MYRYILLFYLFLTTTTLIAQNISGYVISQNGEAVSFASIYLKNKNIGIISDIHGRYLLPVDILEEIGDTLVFSSIGYEYQKIEVSLFKEKISNGNTNIVLKTNCILLSEIEVAPNIRKTKEYGMFGFRSANFIITGKPSAKVMVFIENTDTVNKIIQTVNVRIQKDNDKTKRLRVFFCQKTESGFQNIDVSNEDIFITDFSRSRIRLDVSKYRIPFPEEGIYVGIEWIGDVNTAQRRSREIGLSLKTTTRGSNMPITWIFQNEIWGQFPLEVISEKELNQIPPNFRRLLSNSNAQIGITAH